MGETGRVYDEPDVGDAGVDFDGVTAERAAVLEVCRRRQRRGRRRPKPRRRQRRRGHGRYLDKVLAAPGALDVQLKVEDRESDCLSRLHAHPPSALGVHVVFVGIIGTGQVAVTVELRGRCLTCSTSRQRRTSAVDRRDYSNQQLTRSMMHVRVVNTVYIGTNYVTYLESQTHSFLFTAQLLSGYDND